MNKHIIGIITIVGIALSWSSSRQISFAIQTFYEFKASFFITWYQTCFLSFCLLYPIITCQKIKSTLKNDKIGFKKLIRMSIFFYFILIIGNYLAILSLKHISSSLMVAVFSVTPAFNYILSRIILKEEMHNIKTMAVLFAILGVILIGISQNIHDRNNIGVFFTIFSALFVALYVVLLKKSLGNSSVATTTVLLGIMGLINAVLCWPIFLLLNHFELEIINWDDMPWGYINISAITWFFFNAFINIAVAYTYPLFISVGTVLGVPINMLVDHVIHVIDITPLQIVGSTLIVVAFCILAFGRLTQREFESDDDDEKVELSMKILPDSPHSLDKKIKPFSVETI